MGLPGIVHLEDNSASGILTVGVCYSILMMLRASSYLTDGALDLCCQTGSVLPDGVLDIAEKLGSAFL